MRAFPPLRPLLPGPNYGKIISYPIKPSTANLIRGAPGVV